MIDEWRARERKRDRDRERKRDRERESGKSVLVARHNDDEEESLPNSTY